MIVDCDGHVSARAALWAYKSLILSHRDSHAPGPSVRCRDDGTIAAPNAKEIELKIHFGAMSRAGLAAAVGPIARRASAIGPTGDLRRERQARSI
jgi:hypothetical protein